MGYPDRLLLRALLFDLDGTLVDSYAAIHDSLSHAMRARGMAPLPLEAVRRMVGHGLEVLVAEAMGAENAAEGVKAFRARYDEVCLQKTTFLPEVEETVRALHARGHAMAVCSNKLARFTARILDHLGVGGCFQAVLGPEHVARPKPDPEMLVKALAAIGAAPEGSLYVGDMPLDLQVARAAGVDVAVIASGSASEEELRAAGAERVMRRFSELLELV